ATRAASTAIFWIGARMNSKWRRSACPASCMCAPFTIPICRESRYEYRCGTRQAPENTLFVPPGNPGSVRRGAAAGGVRRRDAAPRRTQARREGQADQLQEFRFNPRRNAMSDHHARILIIGGGAVGCSIAYHLAALGERDVVLLEMGRLTHGATWHAAGLVGQLRGKRNLTRMMRYSAELYSRLEAETGQATGWQPVGSLRVASSAERWQEIRRTATTAKSFGFELELLNGAEAADRFPLMDPEGVVGAAWIPTDGYIDPTSLTNAY